MNLSEDFIRELTLRAISELGSSANPASVKKYIENYLSKNVQNQPTGFTTSKNSANNNESFASPYSTSPDLSGIGESKLNHEHHPNFGITRNNRVLLTSFGINNMGIVASITKVLAESKCDVLDISQKIMQEFYTLIMLIDITNSNKDLKELQETLGNVAQMLNIKIYLQHEDLFRFMHRI